MKLTITKRRAAAVILLTAGFASEAAVAQYQPAPPALDTRCVPTRKKPCPADPPPPASPASTAERFPFPGDAPGSGNPDAQQPVDAPAPAKPQTQTPGASAPAGAAQAFPFPGEPSAPEPSSSSSSNSSSSSSSSSGEDALPDAEKPDDPVDPAKLTRSQRRRLPKVEDPDDREAKDLEVSRYYLSTGNFLAAYLRAQDAVKTIPDDPEAHLALAASAERLKKTQEAVAEYETYLKLDPEGTKAKSARKALSGLQTR